MDISAAGPALGSSPADSAPDAASSALHVTWVRAEHPDRRTVVWCHGLFGQGRNWTAPARALADHHDSLLVDMPNHGRSGWTDSIDLVRWADLVAEAIRAEVLDGRQSRVAVVGHSMGGKIAMALALGHPDLVERLCVVDIAPAVYTDNRAFSHYLGAIAALDLDALPSRAAVDAALAAAITSDSVRAFLLQNLVRERDGDGVERWGWRPNFALLHAGLHQLGDWPHPPGHTRPYPGKVLWLRGEHSGYVTDEHLPGMRTLFPATRLVTVKGADHWVHSDQPEAFLSAVRPFLDAAGPRD